MTDMWKVEVEKVCNKETDGFDVWACNSCGASSLISPKLVVHHKGCRPPQHEWYETEDDADEFDQDMVMTGGSE